MTKVIVVLAVEIPDEYILKPNGEQEIAQSVWAAASAGCKWNREVKLAQVAVMLD